MKRWLYEGSRVVIDDMFDHLALRGAKGWELVAALPARVNPDILLIFKRPDAEQGQRTIEAPSLEDK